MAPENASQIDLLSLPAPQLQQIHALLVKESQQLSQYLQTLHAAKERFKDSESAVKRIEGTPEGSETLIPITSNLYIPGKIGNTSDVIVDVGTGYYVKKSIPDAQLTLQNRQAKIVEKMDELEKVLKEKQKTIPVVRQALQAKLMQQQHVQQKLQKQ